MNGDHTVRDPSSCMGPHRCKGGCGGMVDSREFACSSCWLRLPRHLKIGVWSCWDNQMILVFGMLHRATEWFQENPLSLDTEHAGSDGRA